MNEEVKACPFCGESILAVAKKCKHCSSIIDGSEQAGPQVSKPGANYELAMLAIPVVATMLVWFWVSGMNLLQSPGDTVTVIMLVTILGTAIVAAMEASKVEMSSEKVKGTYGAVAWFFLLALFWLIAYPYYLFKRKYYGLTNRAVIGIAVMLVFLGSSFAMLAEIEKKKAEVQEGIQEFQRQFNSSGLPNEAANSVVSSGVTGSAAEYEELHMLSCKMLQNGATGTSDSDLNRFNELSGQLLTLDDAEHQGLYEAATDPSSCE